VIRVRALTAAGVWPLGSTETAAGDGQGQPDDHDEADHGGPGGEPPVDGAGRSAHVPTAESSQSPKLVNATITASIQYCERVASSTSE
jgi:hypothetical protein